MVFPKLYYCNMPQAWEYDPTKKHMKNGGRCLRLMQQENNKNLRLVECPTDSTDAGVLV